MQMGNSAHCTTIIVEVLRNENSCARNDSGFVRYLADLPYAEIAAFLECSVDAARQNVRAGLAGLRGEVTR